MLAREFRGHRIPDGLVKTTNKEVAIAGRDLKNLEGLKKKALAHERISDDTWALVLPKAKPYAPGAGFDNMVFVAKEHAHVGSLGELAPKQLSGILAMAEGLQDVYREQADAENPIVLETIAVNFHDRPVSEKTFNKKLHAQTLKDLHVHVVGFQKQDVTAAVPLERKNVFKQEWRDLHDPMLTVTGLLWKLPKVQEGVLNGIESLQFSASTELPAMNFTVEARAITSPTFAKDIIRLHQNYLRMYKRISGLFVNDENEDATGMPVLWEKSERDRRIEEFVSVAGEGLEKSDEALVSVHTWLRKMSRLMRSGESIQSEASDPDDKSVFLRGPAYTLSILRQPGSEQTVVNLSPRILSSGNFLASLRLHKVIDGTVSDEWLAKREKTELAISNHFDVADQVAAAK